jgi:hypothetical protein
MLVVYLTANSVAVHFINLSLEPYHQPIHSEYFDPSEHHDVQEQTQAQAKPGQVEPQGTTVHVEQDGQQPEVSLDNILRPPSAPQIICLFCPFTSRSLTTVIDYR